jgi:hypothetical protein
VCSSDLKQTDVPVTLRQHLYKVLLKLAAEGDPIAARDLEREEREIIRAAALLEQARGLGHPDDIPFVRRGGVFTVPRGVSMDEAYEVSQRKMTEEEVERYRALGQRDYEAGLREAEELRAFLAKDRAARNGASLISNVSPSGDPCSEHPEDLPVAVWGPESMEGRTPTIQPPKTPPPPSPPDPYPPGY